MTFIKPYSVAISELFLWLIPLGLWAMAWSGIYSSTVDATTLKDTLLSPDWWTVSNGLRSVLPLIAGMAAMIIIICKLSRQQFRGFSVISPIGFTVCYGCIGVAACLMSPEWDSSLYWVLLYLAVPLVLWAIAWGETSLFSIELLVRFNSLLVVGVALVLFGLAIAYLDLINVMADISSLWKCHQLPSPDGGVGPPWLVLSSGLIRSTGVGRFAAISAVVCFCLLWRNGYWRILGGIGFYMSLTLLLTTGARTSLLGLFVAAPIIAMLHGGRKIVIIGMISVFLIVPLAWMVGIPQGFLKTCVLREYDPTGLYYLNIKSPEPEYDRVNYEDLKIGIESKSDQFNELDPIEAQARVLERQLALNLSPPDMKTHWDLLANAYNILGLERALDGYTAIIALNEGKELTVRRKMAEFLSQHDREAHANQIFDELISKTEGAERASLLILRANNYLRMGNVYKVVSEYSSNALLDYTYALALNYKDLRAGRTEIENQEIKLKGAPAWKGFKDIHQDHPDISTATLIVSLADTLSDTSILDHLSGREFEVLSDVYGSSYTSTDAKQKLVLLEEETDKQSREQSVVVKLYESDIQPNVAEIPVFSEEGTDKQSQELVVGRNSEGRTDKQSQELVVGGNSQEGSQEPKIAPAADSIKDSAISKDARAFGLESRSPLVSVPESLASDSPNEVIQHEPPIKDKEMIEGDGTKLPSGFLYLSGRTSIWMISWEFIKQSLWIGHGFLADRLVLGTHVHNAVMHSLLQTGILGTLFFVAGLAWTIGLVVKISKNLKHLKERQQYLFIQSVGVILIIAIRSIFESSGAFFGIDWLLLAPILLYMQMIWSNCQTLIKSTGFTRVA